MLLMMDPTILAGRKDLPITLFESVVHVVDGAPSTIFVNSNYSVEVGCFIVLLYCV